MKIFPAFRKSNRGVAAIEFALLLPFLLLVVFGVYEITYYVEATRKLDNITNDIGYILSREGCIASDSSPTHDCTGAITFTGGKTDLENIYTNILPFLVYPYGYSSTNGTSQIQVKYVGMPVFLNPGTATCPGTFPYNSDGINRQTLRVMWEHRVPLNTTGVKVSPDNDIIGLCNGANCPGVCGSTASSSNRNLSTYSDSFGSRADIKYSGQSFILVNFAFDFRSLLGDNFPGVSFVLPKKLEKVTSYAVRSRWVDGAPGGFNDGQIQTSELINYMQYCTDCNVYSSRYDTPNDSTTMNAPGTGPAQRQLCVPVGAANRNIAGGCVLN